MITDLLLIICMRACHPSERPRDNSLCFIPSPWARLFYISILIRISLGTIRVPLTRDGMSFNLAFSFRKYFID